MKKMLYVGVMVVVPLIMQAADQQKALAADGAFGNGSKSAVSKLYDNIERGLDVLAQAERENQLLACREVLVRIQASICMLKVEGIPGQEIETTMVQRLEQKGSKTNDFMGIMSGYKD